MKIALVHDWLTGMRGGEKVLEIFCELFPSADIFTLLHIPGSVSALIEKHKIITSYFQRLPLIEKKYRYYLPLMPMGIESFNLSEYDVVISSSHCVAKGCRPKQGAMHLCCCFTPMRYIWDQYENYFGLDSSFPVRCVMKLVRPCLQKWDVHSSKRVAEFIAISQFVADRIKKYYGRESAVIYPPVNTEFFDVDPSGERQEFYLIVSALAPYKRIDIAIDAFNKSGKKLKIIGSGQSEKQLKERSGSNVEFLGWVGGDDLRRHYRTCKALIFPGVEDFGIVPLEAMACGKPVIAFGEGGVLETVIGNKTGIFFKEQKAEGLMAAVQAFEQRRWNPSEIRQQALKFSKKEFIKNFTAFISKKTPLSLSD